jgi:glycosyltransferase involved in cell wall biosynthesis
MLDVTILIKTFERQACLRRLLRSIQDRGYNCPVFIGDDSRQPYRDAVLAEFGRLVNRYLELPFDVGISVGRNALLQEVRTPYFILCDDDFIFDERTDLAHMRRLLDAAGLDLLGGVYYDRSPFSGWDAAACIMRLDWQRLLTMLGIEIPRITFYNFDSCGAQKWKTVDVVYTPPVVRCDYVSNFFLARTDQIRETVGGWDASLKLSEHRAFFLKAKQCGLRVGHTEEVGVQHFRELSPLYSSYRQRSRLMQPRDFVEPALRERFGAMFNLWGRIYQHHRSGRQPPRFHGDGSHASEQGSATAGIAISSSDMERWQK